MPEVSDGTGLASLLSYILAVFGVLAVLGGILWFVRRNSGVPVARKTGPVRRLAVVDQIALDDKRRLVLVQRDGVQHLVILGGANELLVEGGIVEGRGARRDWDVHAPEGERDLPAFPALPLREAPAREAPPRPTQEPPFPEPRLPERAARASVPEPEPVLRSPPRPPAPDVAARAPQPEPARFDPAPRPAPRRPEPVPAAHQAVAASVAAAPPDVEPKLGPLDLIRPKMPEAEAPPRPAPEPVVSAAIEPAAQEPAGAQARGGGLLARLARKKPLEAAPPATARTEELADESSEFAREPFAEPIPELPSHAGPETAFEPRIDPVPAVTVKREDETRPTERQIVPPPVVIPAATERPAATQITPEPPAARAEPDMSQLFEMISAEELSPSRTEPPPVDAKPMQAGPVEAGPTATPAEGPRTAVKIDPVFASMAQRLEETLRRPVAPQPPSVAPAPATAPAPAPQKAAAAEPAPTAKPDELELEMASLLGRATQR